MARGRELLFETETAVEGRIASAPAGIHGFGYDPIFFYAPLGKTMAELTDLEKSAISHRARAFRNLKQVLRVLPVLLVLLVRMVVAQIPS